jgi:hypothetical protein
MMFSRVQGEHKTQQTLTFDFSGPNLPDESQTSKCNKNSFHRQFARKLPVHRRMGLRWDRPQTEEGYIFVIEKREQILSATWLFVDNLKLKTVSKENLKLKTVWLPPHRR